MKKPIFNILLFLLTFATGVNAATTDFTRVANAYCKLDNVTTTVTESNTGEENSGNINEIVNRCVDTILITTECLDKLEHQNIPSYSSETRSGNCKKTRSK